MISFTVLFYTLGSVAIVTSQFSLFSKTRTITDTSYCRDIVGIKKFSSSYLLDCMMICSNDDECRRMMYCSSDKPSCTTFTDGTNCITHLDSGECTCFKRKLKCDGKTCNCSLGHYGDKCQHVHKDCSDFSKSSKLSREVRINIQPPTSPEPFEIYCHPSGGWATIFYRTIYCSHENFNRSMSEYEEGFGKVPKNMWLGFNRLSQIMAIPGSFILNFLFVMEDDHSNCQSNYNNFSLTNKDGGYALGVSVYQSGSKCGDSIMGFVMNLRGRKFSTYDQDHTGVNECAKRLGGGWWFADDINCSRSFLTGTLEINKNDTRSYWRDDLGNRPFRRIQLRILRM